MDSTLIATAITVFVSLTGWLLWVSYKHPKAYGKLVSVPALIVLIFCGLMLLGGIAGSIAGYFKVADVLPEIEAVQEPLSKSRYFVRDVGRLIGALRSIGLGIAGIAIVVGYFSLIEYIGKTLRESEKDDEVPDDTPKPEASSDPE